MRRLLCQLSLAALVVASSVLVTPSPASADSNPLNCTPANGVLAWQLQRISTVSTKSLYGRSVQVVTGYLGNTRYVYARLVRAPGETTPGIPYQGDSFWLSYGRPGSEGPTPGYCGTYVFNASGGLNHAIYATRYYTGPYVFEACGSVAYPPPGGPRQWCAPIWY